MHTSSSAASRPSIPLPHLPQGPHASRQDAKQQPDASLPGQSARYGRLQPADLPDTPRSSLSSMSPRLPGLAEAKAEGKAKPEKKGAVPDLKSGPSTADDQRFVRLVPAVEVLGWTVTGLVKPGNTPVGEGTALAGKAITQALQDGFKATLRDVRLDTDADAVALARTLAPAVEASFDTQILPGSAVSGGDLGSSALNAAIGILLTQIQALRPVSVDLLADAILPQVKNPQAWVRGLMLRPEHATGKPPYEAMIGRIARIAREQGDPESWRSKAALGMVQAQKRQLDMANDLVKMIEACPDPRLLSTLQSASGIPLSSPGMIRQLHAQTLGNTLALRRVACEHALELGPRALSLVVDYLTAQVEQSAPSTLKALTAQAASLFLEVLSHAGMDHVLVLAVIQGLDRGANGARPPEERHVAQASIRQGLLLALDQLHDKLAPGLRLLAGGDPVKEAQLARTFDAVRLALLTKVAIDASPGSMPGAAR